MFWTRKPPPTKAELAKQAALSAATSLSERASDLSSTLSSRAHDWIDAVPTETINQKWDELRHTAADRVAEAEKLLAEKWAVTRPVVEAKAHDAADKAQAKAQAAAQSANDAAHVAAAKAQEAAQSAVGRAHEAAHLAAERAQAAQKEAARRRAELDKQIHAQAEEFGRKREALSAKQEELKQSLADKASDAQAKAQGALKWGTRRAQEAKEQAEEHTQQTLEVAKGAVTTLPVVVAANEEIHAFSDDSDAEILVHEESGGTSILLWLGVGLILGAIAIYFFAPGSGGRRSRAAIKDRLSKVKDDLVDETTKKSDNTSARIEAITAKADSKLAEVAGVVADKVEDVAHTLSAKVEEAGESLAQGIEHAGTSASDTAHTAAEKVEDAKQVLAEKLDTADEPAATFHEEAPTATRRSAGNPRNCCRRNRARIAHRCGERSRKRHRTNRSVSAQEKVKIEI